MVLKRPRSWGQTPVIGYPCLVTRPRIPLACLGTCTFGYEEPRGCVSVDRTDILWSQACGTAEGCLIAAPTETLWDSCLVSKILWYLRNSMERYILKKCYSSWRLTHWASPFSLCLLGWSCLYTVFNMRAYSVTSVVSDSLWPYMECRPQGSSIHGIFQARILEWVAMSSSRGSSWPRDWTGVSCISCIAGGFFTHWATWEAFCLRRVHKHFMELHSLD